MPQDTAVAPVITASGTTWAQYKAGGLAIVIEKLITANPAKANPTTQATATATGGGSSGGSLAAGDYYIAYTWVDAFGETTIGTSRSAVLTVEATNIPRITIPSLPTGVSFANIYLTPAGGAAGTEVLYATGVTTTTFDASYAAATDTQDARVPQSNTTGAGLDASQSIRASLGLSGGTERAWYSLHEKLSAHLSGLPVTRRAWLMTPFHARGLAKFFDTALAEIVTLAVANQGTLGWTTNGMGHPILRRTL